MRYGLFIFATAGIAAVSALNVLPVRAQSQTADTKPLAFEVASVKPNSSGDARVDLGFAPGGRFNATNVTLRILIRNAYSAPQPLADNRLVGGPNWIDSDRFDVMAKAENNPPPGRNGPPPQMLLMMRTLLVERFKLAMHNEKRELPVYLLMMTRRDRQLGPRLIKAAGDCADVTAARNAGTVRAGDRPLCGVSRPTPGNMVAGAVTMDELATILSNFVNRPVIDKTALTGNLDLDLTWTLDQLRDFKASADLPPGTLPKINGVPFDPNGPSLFTAIQEQLGLKLESTKGSVEVLVIDHAERPMPD